MKKFNYKGERNEHINTVYAVIYAKNKATVIPMHNLY
jgi:hypothetical protein